jgi:predicted kinase
MDDPIQKEIVILTGIPGSGKSTFAKTEFPNYLRINLDTIRSRRKEEKLLGEALEAGRSVVIDNTNITIASRKKYIDLAKKHGVRVRSIYLDCPLDLARSRNAKRLGKEKVPDFVLKIYMKKLVIPAVHEGFDTVEIKRIDS